MPTPDKIIDKIVDQISDLINQSSASRQDIKANVKHLMQAQLAKLDVVSREEFEAQQLILEKSRTQIDQLKAQLAELEKKVG